VSKRHKIEELAVRKPTSEPSAAQAVTTYHAGGEQPGGLNSVREKIRGGCRDGLMAEVLRTIAEWETRDDIYRVIYPMGLWPSGLRATVKLIHACLPPLLPSWPAHRIVPRSPTPLRFTHSMATDLLAAWGAGPKTAACCAWTRVRPSATLNRRARHLPPRLLNEKRAVQKPYQASSAQLCQRRNAVGAGHPACNANLRVLAGGAIRDDELSSACVGGIWIQQSWANARPTRPNHCLAVCPGAEHRTSSSTTMTHECQRRRGP
jgi:hypothetical protein